MTIVLNTLTNPTSMSSSTQTFTATQPQSFLEIKHTVTPTSLVSPSVGVKMTSAAGDSLILQNTATTSGSSQTLSFVTNGGTTTNILSASNGAVAANFGTLSTVSTASIGGGLTVGGSATISNNMTVSGGITGGSLAVTNAANLSGALTVSGAASFTGGATVSTTPANSTDVATVGWVNAQLASMSTIKNVLFAVMQGNQSTNLAINDHVKFDTTKNHLDASAPYPILDGTSAYSNATNTASLGRITLRANKWYKITSYIICGGATGRAFAWFNSDINNFLYGDYTTAAYSVVTSSGSFTSSGTQCFVYQVGSVDIRIELRFLVAVTSAVYGLTSGVPCYAIVEQLN